jgi:hypothetical protein
MYHKFRRTLGLGMQLVVQKNIFDGSAILFWFSESLEVIHMKVMEYLECQALSCT